MPSRQATYGKAFFVQTTPLTLTYMKRLLLLLFIFISYYSGQAQTQQPSGPTPAQTLRLARATYEQGRLHEVPSQLNEGVLAGMTKQEKVSAYTLLCLSYIYLEEAEKADENMLKILQTDPYFIINPVVDPAEFVALYKTFRRNPIYRIGATLGGNFTQPNVQEILNTTEGSAEYKAKFGFQFGISADYPLTFISDRLTLHGDLIFQPKKFELTTKTNQGDGDINSTVATESQQWVSFPVSFQFNLLKQNDLAPRKYNPYVALGFSTDFRISSEIDAERTRGGEASIEPKKFELKTQRENINLSILCAAGVKTRFAGGLIGLEVRYIYGLTDVNSEETAYDDKNQYLTYGLPNPIFKMNSLAFAVTYVQNIFKPKKL